MTNPVPLLYELGLDLQGIHRATGLTTVPNKTLHDWYNAITLPDDIHKRLFWTSLFKWGHYWDIDTHRDLRKSLFRCYFQTRPHIYHYLYFGVGAHNLLKTLQYSERLMDKILKRPKVYPRHLRAVAPGTIAFIRHLKSQDQTRQATALYRAMTDKKRVYHKHDIIID